MVATTTNQSGTSSVSIDVFNNAVLSSLAHEVSDGLDRMFNRAIIQHRIDVKRSEIASLEKELLEVY